MNDFVSFPSQQKPFKQKGVKWRKQCVDWAVARTYINYSPVRNSVTTKLINQDLVNGKIHMSDLQHIVNPSDIKASYIPDSIQHYPIINSKLNVLRGEESKRIFDWKVVVTNPNSISEIENNKKQEIFQRLQQMVADKSQSEEEFNQELEKIDYYFNYQWQDFREIRANRLLAHYSKEQNFPLIFNNGFWDAMTFGEELYQVDIVGGEPVLEKLNPIKVRSFRSGYSNNFEDADIIVLEDYWSPGKIIDYYYDALTEKDIKYIESIPFGTEQDSVDAAGNCDDRAGFINANLISDQIDNNDEQFFTSLFSEETESTLMPYDMLGNIRVVRVYWKSRRKIKKVKSYDPQTGEAIYNLYPENYVINKSLGEEEKVYWINEAWEGTKIGENIYVNMRPRVIQFNRITNPSRCHFGIIGSIYGQNGQKPFSLVDMMKPYSYYYDALHDRLNKLIEQNWGKLVTLDLAKKPSKWPIDKWMYYAKINHLMVIDSFNEGTKGNATGKLVGGMNNASSGVVDAELGNSIQSYLTLLEFIKGEMGEVAGISRQREGQVSNRETVGGVERATLQSSHITEYLFTIHDDIKKRVHEAFLEVCKIALKGGSKKFSYILDDGSERIMEIDGDQFAECDYGLVVDNSNELQNLSQKLDMLTQAALQNQYSLSVIMKLYTSTSLMEKIRMIEKEEQNRQQQQQQMQQQQMQIEQQKIQQEAQIKQAEMEQEYKIASENNETKILVAEINSQAEADRLAMMNAEDDGVQEMSETDRAKLKLQASQFDKELQLKRDTLELQRQKIKKDQQLKEKQINKTNKTK